MGYNLNPISYTSLTPSLCEETLGLPMGHVCMTRGTINKLIKHKDSILGPRDQYKNRPLVSDRESLPTDGSKEANTIIDYIKGLDVISEYDVLTHTKVKKLIGKSQYDKEMARFKIPADRYIARGSCIEDVYKVLVRWSKVFKFFSPVHVDIKKLSSADFIKALQTKKVAAAIISISTLGSNDDDSDSDSDEEVEEGGWHAVAILVDIRNKNDSSIEYFDSSGAPPTDSISNVMSDLSKTLGIKQYAVTYRRVHQFTPSECGILSMIYVRRRLEGITRFSFYNYSIPSVFAINFRKFVFSA